MIKKILNILKNLFCNRGIYFVGSEVKYVKLSMEGDVYAKNKLIEHNLRLVVFLSKKYENTGIDLEDLVSIGTIGLIKGVSTYKLDKNIKLATYASRCIANEILMFLRKNKRKKIEVSLEETLNYDSEGNELRLEDILGTSNDIVPEEFENLSDKELLKQEISLLPDREKEIMTLQSYISRIEKKIVKKLQNIMKI